MSLCMGLKFFLLFLLSVKHFVFSALLSHLTSCDLIPRDLPKVQALMTEVVIAITALFFH